MFKLLENLLYDVGNICFWTVQMEGVRVFSPDDWEASGMDATTYAAGDLKKCLEGLAQHLFGKLKASLS